MAFEHTKSKNCIFILNIWMDKCLQFFITKFKLLESLPLECANLTPQNSADLYRK